MEVVIIMGLFDKFKRKIPPMVQVFYNQDFGFLIVPNTFVLAVSHQRLYAVTFPIGR